MKRLLAILGCAAGIFLSTAVAQTPPRATHNFNPGWKLLVGDPAGAEAPGFDDSSWKAVTLPHAWNEDDAFKKDIKDHTTGIAWYRKTFKLPAEDKGRKVFLEFEGVRHGAEFWLNGQKLGRHENGVMAVGFDVTALVKPAPETNVLAVRTDNSWDYREVVSGSRFQWADRNFNANYGGIPKNVRLHVTHPLHQTLPLHSHLGTTGVYIYATDFDITGRSAVIHAESEVRFEPREERKFTYDVTIEDMDGRVVKQFSGGEFTAPPRGRVFAKASAKVDGLNFWSWGYGYLYTVTTTLKLNGEVVDSVRTRTGFRKLEYKNGRVALNDRVIQIKGYAQRTSNEWPAIGLSVPPWLSDYSNGLMVESGANTVRWMHVTPWKQDVESCDRVGLMQLMPAGDAENDAQGRTWAMRVELMRDAIIYNRNNPSIVFYEGGNKGIDEGHMRELRALRDQYDPHGGRAMGAREMLDSKVSEWGGEMLYINKSAGQPLFQTEYSRDEGLRKYWDEFSPPFHKDGDGPLYNGQNARDYNRNQDSHAIENVRRWYDYWRERPGTGARVNGGGLNIIFSDTNTHHRGAENYRRSGEVDAMRIPKDGFFAHQVMWDGWVDVEKPRAHLIGHWNYAAGTKKNISVVSSADRVELFLNGKSLGQGKQSSRFLFTFENIEWQPGTLRAVGLDAAGKQLCTAELHTAGEPAALRLNPITNPAGFKADAADLALVEVEVVDAQGRRCPTALNLVDFNLSGPGEWRGGIAQGPDNYILAKSLPVECGVNRVLIRSTTTPGKISVTARSAGLKEASIELVSQPVAITDGLAAAHPADGIAPYLKRGPTPATPSFKPTRLAVPVARATSGDGNDPKLAFDDNELTAWIGRQPITFEFAREARLSEVTVKTGGFRARSYPIKISVDGKEVWRGATVRSLGYATITFPPTAGRTMKIEVLGGSEARDAFGGIRELEDQKNATTGEERVGAGQLSLSEIEFYEPVPPPPGPLSMDPPENPGVINPALPTIFVAGDSTAARAREPQQGWAVPFADYFDLAKMNVVNLALGGRSSRTFITQGWWDKLIAQVRPGDVVLLQFGHNDASAINDTSRARGVIRSLGEETEQIDNLLTKQPETVHTYGWYFRKMIADVKAKGATPIVLSITLRNQWKDGKVERDGGPWRELARGVAAASGVAFVDLSDLIGEQYDRLGPEAVKPFFPRDGTHTGQAGADLNASLVVAGLKGLRPSPISAYLSAKGAAIPAAPPKP